MLVMGQARDEDAPCPPDYTDVAPSLNLMSSLLRKQPVQEALVINKPYISVLLQDKWENQIVDTTVILSPSPVVVWMIQCLVKIFLDGKRF